MREECPICGNKLVIPSGPPDSPVLLLGEFPGHFEILNGWPFAGPAGEILEAELDRVGLRMGACRITNLWLHGVTPSTIQDGKKKLINSAYEVEHKWHTDLAMEELANPARKVALLMGSDVARYFGYGNVSDVTGMVVKAKFIPKKLKAIACYNPAIAEYGTIGEVRLAIEKLAALCGERGIWK